MFLSTTIIRELTLEPGFIMAFARLKCKLPDDGRGTKHIGTFLI
jgi:hypothetical protein